MPGVVWALLLVAITLDTKWLTNKQIGLLGLSFLLIGLGAWKNVKHVVEFVRPTPFTPAGIAKYSQSIPTRLAGHCGPLAAFRFFCSPKTYFSAEAGSRGWNITEPPWLSL